MTGKHPANLCPNAKDGKVSCHTCMVPSCSQSEAQEANGTDANLIAEITKKVLAELGK